MTQSTHFRLNLVEGSDIVNPLIQDVPNYEAIDEQMFANQNAGIGTATELTSGTVHAITRAIATTGVFRFTATARYNYGDTFTVDGVSVTATAPDGSALADGAYVIGGTVLCSLVGQLLVVYTNAVALASDSAKLGGQLPAYYGTKAEVDNAQALAEASATLAQNAKDSLDKIGTRANGSTATNKIANNTSTNVGVITLEPGVWLVTATLVYSSSGTGIRLLKLTTSEGSPAALNTYNTAWNAVGGGATTNPTITIVVNVSSTVNYYLSGWHNAGATLTVNNSFSAVRIK